MLLLMMEDVYKYIIYNNILAFFNVEICSHFFFLDHKKLIYSTNFNSGSFEKFKSSVKNAYENRALCYFYTQQIDTLNDSISSNNPKAQKRLKVISCVS
jgi:hypothetical protein